MSLFYAYPLRHTFYALSALSSTWPAFFIYIHKAYSFHNLPGKDRCSSTNYRLSDTGAVHTFQVPKCIGSIYLSKYCIGSTAKAYCQEPALAYLIQQRHWFPHLYYKLARLDLRHAAASAVLWSGKLEGSKLGFNTVLKQQRVLWKAPVSYFCSSPALLAGRSWSLGRPLLLLLCLSGACLSMGKKNTSMLIQAVTPASIAMGIW